MTNTSFICPACNVRDVDWDCEPPSPPSPMGHCQTCFSLRASAPHCSKPACLTGGHTCERTQLINAREVALDDTVAPLYRCTRCCETGTSEHWGHLLGTLDGEQDGERVPDLAVSRRELRRKELTAWAAAAADPPPLWTAPHPRTIAYGRAYVAATAHVTVSAASR